MPESYPQKNTKYYETMKIMIEGQEFEEPIPHWARSASDGRYMIAGSQLRTRDGRVFGNAFVNRIYISKYNQIIVAECYTDAGSKINLNLNELKECFYKPIYIMDLARARKRFIRE